MEAYFGSILKIPTTVFMLYSGDYFEFSQIPEIESLIAIIYTLPKSQFTIYHIFKLYVDIVDIPGSRV
jgi:hypothetical protein